MKIRMDSAIDNIQMTFDLRNMFRNHKYDLKIHISAKENVIFRVHPPQPQYKETASKCIGGG
jgi:hypothetical protein